MYCFLVLNYVCSLFVTGFKRPLTNEDLWSLLSEEKTSTVSAMFLSEWQKEMEKAKG